MISLSLDPSVNNVGWSVFNSRASTPAKAWRWGTWHLEGCSLEMRLTFLCQTIATEVGDFDYLITERPAFFSSEKGQIAAHMNYTIDLSAVCYYTAGFFNKDHRTHFAITANTWKGQTPKHVTERRFFLAFRKLGKKVPDEHGIDATMLHRFWLDTVARYLPRYNRKINLARFDRLLSINP